MFELFNVNRLSEVCSYRYPRVVSLPRSTRPPPPNTSTPPKLPPQPSPPVSRTPSPIPSISTAAAAGAFPIRSIQDKVECCNACFLGQNCYVFQFNDPALSPPGSDACILYQFTSAPTPAAAREPTATCPRGYGRIQQFAISGGDYTGRTFEEGPCIDTQMK